MLPGKGPKGQGEEKMKVAFQKTQKGRTCISVGRDLNYYVQNGNFFPKMPDMLEFSAEEEPEYWEDSKPILEKFGLFDDVGNEILNYEEYLAALSSGCGTLDCDGEYDTLTICESKELDDLELKIVAANFPEEMPEIMEEHRYTTEEIKLAKKNKDWEGLIDLKKDFISWHQNEGEEND
jgi:hypothetical protein